MAVFFLLCACILAFNLLVYFNVIGLPSSHVLLPYQSGMLFRCGRPVRAVGPGRHRVFVGREKILFLDMRPIQVNIENRAVTLADGSTAVYGFNASAKVNDVQKATYASTIYSQVPAFVTLCVARSSLSGYVSSHLAAERVAVEKKNIDTCKSRLASAGFELVSFKFSKLSVMDPY